MRQIILTETPAGWTYTLLIDGQPVASDGPYDQPADAIEDATSCPTAI